MIVKKECFITLKQLEKIDNNYKCPFCDKLYSKMGICTHIWRNHSELSSDFNPNIGYSTGTKKAWNKNLTKLEIEKYRENKREKERLRKRRIKSLKPKIRYNGQFTHCVECGKEIDGKYGNGKYCSRQCSRKEGGKARAKKIPFGGHTSKLRIDYITKNGEVVKLQSSYEIKVAKSLDENNINWIRPNAFKWKDSKEIEHRYYPDFYLIDYDVYLDPKNDYLVIKDKEKIERVSKQNNIYIIVLNKDNLDWVNIKNFLKK